MYMYINLNKQYICIFCPSGYERVYMPLCEVTDTPFHIQDHISDSQQYQASPLD